VSAPWWPENLCPGGDPEAEIRDHRVNSTALQACVWFIKSLKRKVLQVNLGQLGYEGSGSIGLTVFQVPGEKTGTRYRRSKRLSARRRSWRCGAGPVAGLAKIRLRNSREVETCLQETCRLLH